MEKKRSVFGRIIVGILVVLGILFILLMLLPDEEEETMPKVESQTETHSPKETAAESEEPPQKPIDPVSVGTNAKSATILIYMNGSDLETRAGEATQDISEMLSSGIGENVNVIIQTMGTYEWQDYDISPDTSQIYRVKNKKLELIKDDLGQLDCTSSDTLSRFISYGKTNFPADRYILLFWDHGGGPVYGFGYDEWQDEEEALTLDEMRKAFSENPDVHFDMIGMDCCIMASIETCYAFAPYCNYALLSEDFESSLGWAYEEWMESFEEDPSMSTPLLGKKIIDSVISANENDSENGESSTLILANERAVPDLFEKWTDYAYKNEDSLLGVNYSKLHKSRGKGFIEDLISVWVDDDSDVTMEDYFVSDVLSIVESVGKEGKTTDSLRSALKACVAYFGHTDDTNELTGLSVSLPYGDEEFYEELSSVYKRCGFDAKYVDWLERFVDAPGRYDYNDYSDFEESWGGWESYEEGWRTGSEYCEDDWVYDYEEELWYLYEDDILYLYDDVEGIMYYYDEYEDIIYRYDEDKDEWIEEE